MNRFRQNAIEQRVEVRSLRSCEKESILRERGHGNREKSTLIDRHVLCRDGEKGRRVRSRKFEKGCFMIAGMRNKKQETGERKARRKDGRN